MEAYDGESIGGVWKNLVGALQGLGDTTDGPRHTHAAYGHKIINIVVLQIFIFFLKPLFYLYSRSVVDLRYICG